MRESRIERQQHYFACLFLLLLVLDMSELLGVCGERCSHRRLFTDGYALIS